MIYSFYYQELNFKNFFIFRLQKYAKLKINLKINLKNKINKINFNLLQINLLKKNYYNLLNFNFFLQKLLFFKPKLNLPLISQNIKLQKNSLKSILYNTKFNFFVIFFILKKNSNITKNLFFKKKIKKNFKKKKPKIKLNLIKLLKNLTSYNNQSLFKSYDFDFVNNLILKLNFNFLISKKNNINSNFITNLVTFNLLKVLKH